METQSITIKPLLEQRPLEYFGFFHLLDITSQLREERMFRAIDKLYKLGINDYRNRLTLVASPSGKWFVWLDYDLPTVSLLFIWDQNPKIEGHYAIFNDVEIK